MRDLLSHLTATFDQGLDCVYCAVVETRGSTPQKAGAAMLVFPDGGQVGTLGGGCVEAEVRQRALRVLSNGGGQADLLTFSLDDNYGWDDGLICGGRMTILADPVRKPDPAAAYYRRYLELIDDGHGCTEAVVLSADAGAAPGSRYLFAVDGTLVTQLGDGPPPGSIASQLVPLERRPRPYVQKGVSYLPFLPKVSLLIVGGGHVGQGVAKLAADVDFDVWVVDDREKYVSRERFPMARRILIGDIGETLKKLGPTLTPSVFAIIVTRGHSHDEEALYHLANTRAGYVGLIGSKRKIKLIYQDLLAKNIPESALERVHAPLGYHIGSQTVPEIAVSIVAELIACRNLGKTDVVRHKDLLNFQSNQRSAVSGQPQT